MAGRRRALPGLAAALAAAFAAPGAAAQQAIRNTAGAAWPQGGFDVEDAAVDVLSDGKASAAAAAAGTRDAWSEQQGPIDVTGDGVRVGEVHGWTAQSAQPVGVSALTVAGSSDPVAAASIGTVGQAAEQMGMFHYHKAFWPPDAMDVFAFVFSAVGLVIAAGGGIGGGGILVPLFMIFMKFRPKHAIALSNFTILGGSIANTAFNIHKSDDEGEGLIDWDIIVMMEPTTIAGAAIGSFLAKSLPDFVLTMMLGMVLMMLSYRTLDKGFKMFQKETEEERGRKEGHDQLNQDEDQLEDQAGDDEDGDYAEVDCEEGESEGEGDGDVEGDGAAGFHESHTLIGGEHASLEQQPTPWRKVGLLMVCFMGCVVLMVLKGNGAGSIIGVECGSGSFWTLSLATVPWVITFGAVFRRILMKESLKKLEAGKLEGSEVRWDKKSTIKYPAVCTLAGIFAGLFGVGGGIVKGPLMLEMGVDPMVAAATAATMILFTTTAACVSFEIFGLLEPWYGIVCFILGLVCTAVGQGSVNAWMRSRKRQSPPVLSIGLVMALSTLLVFLEAFEKFAQQDLDQLLTPASICSLTS